MAGPVPGPVGTAAGRPAHRDSPGETRTKEHQMTGNTPPGTRILGSLRSADGKGVVRVEDRGMPLDTIAFYGAGWQIHAETLAAYLAGRRPGDTQARWDELVPPYQDLAANIG